MAAAEARRAGGPTGRLLPDRRLHLQHGPIDLVIGADGSGAEVRIAYRQAWQRFQDILETLVGELSLLRRPVDDAHPGVAGPVARRMFQACRPHQAQFITPMAAVAGAVADEILAALIAGRRLAKAYVNNGGDIALHVAPGESLTAGVVGNADAPVLDGIAAITSDMPVRGIATSGWRGRSFSLGIADAATVLARDAAAADAAATLVANAVDLAHPAIARRPASDLDETSDLGERLVTVAVGPLEADSVATALDRGAARAEAMRGSGLIHGAVLLLQREYRVVGPLSLANPLPLAPLNPLPPAGEGRVRAAAARSDLDRLPAARCPHPDPLPQAGEGTPKGAQEGEGTPAKAAEAVP